MKYSGSHPRTLCARSTHTLVFANNLPLHPMLLMTSREKLLTWTHSNLEVSVMTTLKKHAQQLSRDHVLWLPVTVTLRILLAAMRYYLVCISHSTSNIFLSYQLVMARVKGKDVHQGKPQAVPKASRNTFL
jgi:hypothetical protein